MDKIEGLPQSARQHLIEMMDPKRSLAPNEIEGFLPVDMATEMVKSEKEHPMAPSIEKLLTLIESHKTLQQKHMEGSFAKMDEALSAKKQLFNEINEFEIKQRTALNITTTALFILLVVFLASCMWYKRTKRTEAKTQKKDQSMASHRWINTGTEKEQHAKIEKMTKLEETLKLMDEELVKMKKELEELKKLK